MRSERFDVPLVFHEANKNFCPSHCITSTLHVCQVASMLEDTGGVSAAGVGRGNGELRERDGLGGWPGVKGWGRSESFGPTEI